MFLQATIQAQTYKTTYFPSTLVQLAFPFKKHNRMDKHFYSLFVIFLIYTQECWGQNPCEPNPCGENTRCLTQVGSSRPVISCKCLPGKLSEFFEKVFTVNNKKTRTPCFSTLRFSRISPEPLKLKKIYLHFFISAFKELSAGTEIFQVRWHNQLILAKMLIFQ